MKSIFEKINKVCISSCEIFCSAQYDEKRNYQLVSKPEQINWPKHKSFMKFTVLGIKTIQNVSDPFFFIAALHFQLCIREQK